MPADLGEFGRIREFLRPLARGLPGSLDLNDDAALIAAPDGADLVATMDTIVEGVHFLPTDPPDLVAQKLLRVNLSDLAAMGAQPQCYLLSLALPDRCDDAWVRAFAAGLDTDQKRFGLALLGGDSVATSGPVTLTVSAFGSLAAGSARRRSYAVIGDQLWVSGTIGDGALGLLAATGQLSGLDLVHRKALEARYRLPEPRVALGTALAAHVHAMMDISDGLAADLDHICAASAVGAIVEVASIPLSDAAAAAVALDLDLIDRILAGGDDYELMFTAAPSAETEIRAHASAAGTDVTAIGRIVSEGGVRLVDRDGDEVIVGRRGYAHGAQAS